MWMARYVGFVYFDVLLHVFLLSGIITDGLNTFVLPVASSCDPVGHSEQCWYRPLEYIRPSLGVLHHVYILTSSLT